MRHLLKLAFFICLFLLLGTGCDEEDPTQTSNDLIGSWQLAYYQTEENGQIDDPDDGKPVYWSFKADSTFEGMAGNNEILGEYWLKDASLYFTLYGSEMIGKEWEIRFSNALNHGWTGEFYVIPYSLESNELVLKYVGHNTMYFLPRE